jgi:hypothetical protein
MNNKKSLLGISILTFAILKIVPFVSAQGLFDISRGPNDLVRIVIDFLGPFFEAILGTETGGMYSQYFFARVLFLVLVYIITSIAIGSIDIFKEKKGVNFIISAVVAILGARYIGGMDIIEQMLLPYGALTVGLTILIPFFVYFFFVHKTIESGVGRRAAWIFFAVIFVGLWWTRLKTGTLANNITTEFGWLYQIGILAVVAVTIFDKKVHEYFGLVEASEFKRSVVKRQIADVESELNKLTQISNPSKTTKDVIEHLEKRRSDLARKL